MNARRPVQGDHAAILVTAATDDVAGRRQSVLDEVAAARPGIDTAALDLSDPASITDFNARLRADCRARRLFRHESGLAFLRALPAVHVA
ncbi:hypothetical protein GCM10009539_72460 [Cryptosporangium japonicum]|uniref:Uncharacterized protein n=1 Tax=Cryptosporangium japonicum TaxID=80872 RepID=A0ABP3EU97_9ACTN